MIIRDHSMLQSAGEMAAQTPGSVNKEGEFGCRFGLFSNEDQNSVIEVFFGTRRAFMKRNVVTRKDI